MLQNGLTLSSHRDYSSQDNATKSDKKEAFIKYGVEVSKGYPPNYILPSPSLPPNINIG